MKNAAPPSAGQVKATAQPPAGDALTWFAANVRTRMKAGKLDSKILTDRTGESPVAVGRAVNGTSCSLPLAGKIADALGESLAVLVTPFDCKTCHGKPPAGFACLACAAEGQPG